MQNDKMAQGASASSQHALAKYLLAAALAFIAYYIAGKLGQATTEIRSSNLGPVWPAYGIALAAVLLAGPRIWPAIVASAFIVAVSDVPAITAFGQAVSATIGAVAGGWMLSRAGFERSISRLRDALNLIVLGALASALISSSLGVATLCATGIRPYSDIWSAWFVYCLGDATGVLLITPLVLTGATLLPLRPASRAIEFALLVFLLVTACLLIFADLAFVPVRLHVLAFGVLPLIIWAAIRFGVSGVAFAALTVAVIATVATALGAGPFAQHDTFINAVLLDVFFAVLAVSGLILAAVITERTQGEAERERLIREQTALAERERAAVALHESEEKLRHLQDDLAHLNRVAMVSALSSALAHEINQPLAAVRLNAEVALRQLGTQPFSPAEMQDTLSSIQEDSRRAGEVLQRARALLKKDPARYEEVGLNSTVSEVVKLMHGSAAKRGTIIDIELAPELPPVWGDRVQIQQVVLNLLMNACDAVQGNEKSMRRVSLKTVARPGGATVEVKDRGGGLSDDDLARIFEPFYTTKQDGMGLGLSICRAIVAAHGGTLEAARNGDIGITFAATFPYMRPAAQAQSASS